MKICPACSREYGDEHDLCRDDGVGLVHLDTNSGERAQDLIGHVVDGRYRIERIVGRGGMGTVYACRHVVVGKCFAMKVLRSGIERSEEILQRFIREAQAANAVRSRHICEMSDFGQLPGGAFYVVMELLEGMSLTRGLREKRLKRRDIKHVFIQIATTLQRAHDANIIHRDLKPDNVVLIHEDGDPFFVKLVDFGIAKVLESKASNLTETGVILGTPYYMSPEQARGETIDHRSDIYALGVMMYRAFTGKLPFVADTAMGVLTRHLTEKPELPSLIAEMDPATERLILRCLEKRPIDRFQSMTDVAEALRSIPDELDARACHHPTMDERSPPVYAVAAPRAEPTPTKVATPLAQIERGLRAADAGGVPSSQQPGGGPASQQPTPLRPSEHSPAFPPPLPPPGLPVTPLGMGVPVAPGYAPAGATPAATGPGAPRSPSHSSGPYPVSPSHSSGPYPAPPASLPPSGSAADVLGSHLQGEAATNRGVVSARLQSVPMSHGRRAALWVGVGAVMAAVGAGTALVVFTGYYAPPAGSASSTTAAPLPGPAASEAAGTAAATPPDPVEPSRDAGEGQTTATPSASSGKAARAPASGRPAATPPAASGSSGGHVGPAPLPPNPTVDKPIDDIRSPFDD